MLFEEHYNDFSNCKNCITLFLEGRATTWYVSMCTKHNDDGTYCMDHLHRVHTGSNLLWKLPAKVDKDNLISKAIVECNIDGDWGVSKEENMTYSYTLRNHTYIQNIVQELHE